MLFAVAAALLITASSRAASLATETFDTTMGGWQDRDVGDMTVTNLITGGNPGGCISGTIPYAGIPLPGTYTDAFMATGLLASANFVGNYTDVEAYLLGFDFRANDVWPQYTNSESEITNALPDFLRVNIISASSSFTNKIFSRVPAPPNATNGVWYSFRLPLVDPQLGNWVGDISQFSSIMTNVTRLEVEITRDGDPGARVYLVDNVFLDRLPEAASVVSTNSGVDITWLHLRSGVNYRMDVASDLVQPNWSAVSNITAASSVWVANYSSTNTAILYRLIME